MNEMLSLVYGFALAVWRRRRLALYTAWIAAPVIWLVTLALPDRYEASAVVFVDVRTPLQPALQGIAVDTDNQSQLALVREALLSRPQLEAVARKTNLDKAVTTPAEMDALVSGLQKGVSVVSHAADTGSPNGPSTNTIYTISYQHRDRDKSVEVVRELLRSFEEGTLSGSRGRTSESEEFLTGQIADLDKQMQEDEEKLAEFRKRNMDMLPGERGDYYTRLSQEQSALQQAESSLAVASSRRNELNRQLAKLDRFTPGTSGAAGGGTGSDITTRREQAESRLAELVLRFTDKHPEVVALRENIAELRANEEKELAELRRGAAGTGAIRSLASNPEYQQVQNQLSQVQVEIAGFQGVAQQHRKEIAYLKQFVDQAPEIQQEFANLTREFGARKVRYEQLLQRLEEVKVSDDAAQMGIVRFDTIEPPRAAEQPVWPARPLFILAGLFGAIGAGVALAMLPQLFAPTFSDVLTLERKFGLQVLGAVSAVRDEVTLFQSRHAVRNTVIAVGALVGVAAVLVVFGGVLSSALQTLIG